MVRKVWKGAIGFGLVNIPVTLYPGSRPNELDFDLLGRRDMAPVGYQRINKRTGKPVAWDDIVKGYEYEDGSYVVMSDEDFRQANPKATQTVEILAFVDAGAIEPQYFDTPYTLLPDKRGEKGYTLLRETLKRTRKAGIAQVVIRNRHRERQTTHACNACSCGENVATERQASAPCQPFQATTAVVR